MLSNQPLADRLRPKDLDEFRGQEHLVGEKGVLRKAIESGNIPSFILWGPPGVGKTTLAWIIAHRLKRPFFHLSAVHSGVKDVRETIEKAKKQQRIVDALTVTEQYGFPSWVDVNSKAMTGTFSSLPDRVDLGSDINEQLVVELYSK
jgi:DNA polymerase III delta prime subunit